MVLDIGGAIDQDTPPMPLKHTTETLLIFFLGTAMVVTGIVLPTLTLLEMGIVPWATVFVLAVAYPLLLSRVFRCNRADYSFRMLHWVPAILLLILLLLQGIVYVLPSGQSVVDWYTWGWTLPGVATGFFLIMFFCLRVIRRWTLRIVLLAIIFIPFIVGAVASEHYEWNEEIAATLWEGDWWQLRGDQDSLLAQLNEKNLDASSDPTEELYRDRLRAIESRRERIAQRLEDRRTGEDSSLAAVVVSESSSSVPVEITQVSSMPTRLPSSGFSWMVVILTMLGLYTASVHGRTKERVMDVA